MHWCIDLESVVGIANSNQKCVLTYVTQCLTANVTQPTLLPIIWLQSRNVAPKCFFAKTLLQVNFFAMLILGFQCQNKYWPLCLFVCFCTLLFVYISLWKVDFKKESEVYPWDQLMDKTASLCALMLASVSCLFVSFSLFFFFLSLSLPFFLSLFIYLFVCLFVCLFLSFFSYYFVWLFVSFQWQQVCEIKGWKSSSLCYDKVIEEQFLN
jgi:hypothetical protein